MADISTNPATILKVSADDAQRLAVGKVLSIVAGVVGLLGGLYTLSANPAFKSKIDAAWTKLPSPMQENKIFTLAIAGLIASVVIAKLVVKPSPTSLS
jgi:hypothetical protein